MAQSTLDRRLGPLDAAAIIVANVIGGGILFTPPQVAAAVPNPLWFLVTWLAGGALAFAGAMAYAELAALRPRAGGEYVYLREAYGPLAGFMTGWTSFVAGFAGAMAASAIFLIVTLNRFVPGAADPAPFLVIPLPFVAPDLLASHAARACGDLVVRVGAHSRRRTGPRRHQRAGHAESDGAHRVHRSGVFDRGRFECESAAGRRPCRSDKLAAGARSRDVHLLGVERGVLHGRGDPESGPERPARAHARNGRGRRGLSPVQHALSLRHADRRICGASRGSVLDVIGERLLGVRAGDILAVVALVSLAAGINAWTFAGPRVYYAMARDGVFFPAASAVHPRFKTPHVSITAQAFWASLLILTGSLDSLTNYVGFAITLFAGIAVAAVFVLRTREPDAPRPYKALGYPIAPAIFVLASLAIVSMPCTAIRVRPGLVCSSSCRGFRSTCG